MHKTRVCGRSRFTIIVPFWSCVGGGSYISWEGQTPPPPDKSQCKLPNPKRGRGAESQPKRVLVHFELEVTHAVTTSFILEHFREIQKRLSVGNDCGHWGHVLPCGTGARAPPKVYAYDLIQQSMATPMIKLYARTTTRDAS